MRKRHWVLGLGLIICLLLIRGIFFSSRTIAHISHTSQNSSTAGLLFLAEDTNLSDIRNRRKLRELLSAAEYRQALDSVQYYDKEYQDMKGSHLRTYRAKDYQLFDDTVLVEDGYTARLVMVYDNTLGGGRQYFFQIRTYTKDNHFIDKADFATWSETKKEFCSGWLTDDHFLIRSCSRGEDEIKRINRSGHFIIPSQRTITWLKVCGY